MIGKQKRAIFEDGQRAAQIQKTGVIFDRLAGSLPCADGSQPRLMRAFSSLVRSAENVQPA